MITSSAGFLIATPTKCGTTSLEAVARRHMKNAGIDADLFRIMDWDHPRRQHRMCLPPDVVDEAASLGVGERHTDNWADVDRYLLVRDPFARYASIYKYLRTPANYSQWGAREVQGYDWGGHDESKMVHADPMEFGEFLIWYAHRRAEAEADEARGPLDEGRAYRSPWVWTDSLRFSAEVLMGWPLADGSDVDSIGVLRLEELWGDGGDLERLMMKYDLRDDVNISELHANRSTGWDPGGVFGPQFFGEFGRLAEGAETADFTCVCSASDCPVCVLGVREESEWLSEALWFGAHI